MAEIFLNNNIRDWVRESRLTVIVGHFGTGKTEVAVNMALQLGEAGLPFTLADLDVVDPYFRSRECSELLTKAGGRVITSSQACMDADVPSMPADVASVFDDTERYAVMDIGGDASGARVLAQYRRKIKTQGLDMPRVLAVLNANRPMTPDAEAMISYINSIEEASGFKITGLVNNTHLCGETTEEDIITGADMAREVSRETGIPLVAHTVDERLIAKIATDDEEKLRQQLHIQSGELLFPIKIYMKKPWEV